MRQFGYLDDPLPTTVLVLEWPGTAALPKPVKEAVERLGYQPNLIARDLRLVRLRVGRRDRERHCRRGEDNDCHEDGDECRLAHGFPPNR